jgi:nucleoside-diphosphate-sugar epimerase
MKKVLIIGGNGYIGSRLIYDLSSKYNIHSIDICWFGEPIGNNKTQDYKTLTRSELQQFDAIILLAGHSSVKMCDGPITASWNNNVNNFVDLVKKLDKRQILIYASSGSVYGLRSEQAKEDDDMLFLPVNNYDLTKYTLDIQAQNYIQKGYTIVGFRFGTVNGWSPNTREDLMINSMTKKSVLENELYANNLEIKRPILGIADIVRAIDAVLMNPKSGIYNLASFMDRVSNISDYVQKKTGSSVIITPDLKGIYDFDMSTEKFENTFNFRFTQTIDSIVNELLEKIDKTSFTNRNRFIDYE